MALVGIRVCRTPGCDGEAAGPSGIEAYCRACRLTMPCVERTSREMRMLGPAKAHVSRTIRSHVARAAIAADYALHRAAELEAQARWARQDADEAVAVWQRQLRELQHGSA